MLFWLFALDTQFTVVCTFYETFLNMYDGHFAQLLGLLSIWPMIMLQKCLGMLLYSFTGNIFCSSFICPLFWEIFRISTILTGFLSNLSIIRVYRQVTVIHTILTALLISTRQAWRRYLTKNVHLLGMLGFNGFLWATLD